MVCLPARPLLAGTTLSYCSHSGAMCGGGGRTTRQDQRHGLARVLYSLKERDRLWVNLEMNVATTQSARTKQRQPSWGRRESQHISVVLKVA